MCFIGMAESFGAIGLSLGAIGLSMQQSCMGIGAAASFGGDAGLGGVAGMFAIPC